MNRRAILALVAAVAVVAAGLGWVAGRQIKSPGQIAAEQEPPEPSLITVPVELRTLSQNVVVRGTINRSDETPLSVSSIVGSSVITNLPMVVGDTVDEGDVLIEVAGRPVVALRGPLPAFRNLRPGVEGPDVEQLEEALVRLGHDPGVVDEIYDTSTAAAVAGLYRDLGYPAPAVDPSLEGALDGAEATVEARRVALNDAEQALADAGGTVTDLEKQQLQLAIDQAKADLDDIVAGAAQAKADATQAVDDADDAVTAAEAEASTAADRLAQAEGGTHPDTGQPPTEAELVDLRALDAEADDAVTAAKAALASAEAAEPRIAAQQDLAVTAAGLAVTGAEAARSDRLSPPDLSALRTQVSEATKALTEARTSLTEAQAAAGTWLPTTEVVFLTSTPRLVSSLPVEIGDIPGGTVMTISGAETVIDSGVSAADRSLIELGAEALLEDDDLGVSIPAVVTFLADEPGGGGLSQDRYVMRLEPTGEVPEETIGLNLRISIPITSSGGDVLAVPLAALSAGADGTARVEVELDGSPGATELVEVSTGLRASGFVEVRPLGGAGLEAGDRVVVGRDLVLPGADDGADTNTDGDTDGDPDTDAADEDEGDS